MSISMYQASVPVLVHQMKALSAILAKAASWAEGRKIDPLVLTSARLAPDMFPLTRQIQIASDNAKGAGARLANIEIPSYEDKETTFPELQERLSKTIAFLETLTPTQIDGSEDREITVKMRSGDLNFKGQDYLLGFALPNFYFHVTTAYAILRHNGVEIGKKDFLGAV